MVTTPDPQPILWSGEVHFWGCAEMGVRLSPPEQRQETMIYIGIDPGTDTGLAVWNASEQRFTEVVTASIVGAMRVALDWAEGWDTTLVIEDARKRKYLPREKNLSEYRGKLMGAGSVKRDCSIWEEFADYYNIPIILVPPRKGMTKWDADYFARLTGWKGRTSDHARDAALLVWGRTDTKARKV